MVGWIRWTHIGYFTGQIKGTMWKHVGVASEHHSESWTSNMVPHCGRILSSCHGVVTRCLSLELGIHGVSSGSVNTDHWPQACLWVSSVEKMSLANHPKSSDFLTLALCLGLFEASHRQQLKGRHRPNQYKLILNEVISTAIIKWKGAVWWIQTLSQ